MRFYYSLMLTSHSSEFYPQLEQGFTVTSELTVECYNFKTGFLIYHLHVWYELSVSTMR